MFHRRVDASHSNVSSTVAISDAELGPVASNVGVVAVDDLRLQRWKISYHALVSFTLVSSGCCCEAYASAPSRDGAQRDRVHERSMSA